MDSMLNKILGAIEDRIPLFHRILLIAFIFLAFLGVILATTDFNMMRGASIHFRWDNALLQAAFTVFWPITLAPLWWKLAFFSIGFALLLPHVLFHTDP